MNTEIPEFLLEMSKQLNEQDNRATDDPLFEVRYKKPHMQEIEVTVNSHFTEVDANAFIKRKQQEYPELYTYAISMCYCESMKQLRNWIMSLSNKDNNNV
tara:strand:- start:16 stop:315 length:300 start_codon:yes stop_codon:yes gene_type:complete